MKLQVEFSVKTSEDVKNLFDKLDTTKDLIKETPSIILEDGEF